jgi:hypothetical protein
LTLLPSSLERQKSLVKIEPFSQNISNGRTSIPLEVTTRMPFYPSAWDLLKMLIRELLGGTR